jgi:3-hydroxyanthranilate 3,4-dioxygenase
MPRPAKASTAAASKRYLPGKGTYPNNPVFHLLNLQKWIKANAKDLQPPVSNKQLFSDSKDVVLFVSGGPNTRNDYHVNPTEELFLQLKGDIAVRIRPLDGSPPHDVVIREGELYLLPRWVPHRPQRPKGTAGLVVEFPRPEGELDGLRWYCPKCDELVHEARWRLRKIDEDLRIIMNGFWDGPEAARTCKQCGYVIQRAGAIEVKGGKVRAAGTGKRKAGAAGGGAAKARRRAGARQRGAR